jgi:hypothetical protein
MTPVLLDASSAILLHKADLLETVTTAFAAFTVPSVYREVTVVGRPGAAWFVHAFSKGRMRLFHMESASLGAGPLAGLGSGERDTLSAYGLGAARFIIIDDYKGVKCCRALAIPHINALLCTKVLYWAGWIERQVSSAAFDFLLHEGRYSPYVADYVRRCTAAEVTVFYPEL